MTDNIENFQLARLRKEVDNKNVGVRDLLSVALADIDRGDYKNPKRALIIIIDEIEGDGSSSVEMYRCGMDRAQELGWLEAAKQHTWLRWRRGAAE